MTLTSVFLALVSKGSSKTVLRNPTLLQTQSAESIHVLGFTSHGDLLVAESEGSFTIEEWETVYAAGKAMCCDESKTEDHIMQDEPFTGMNTFVKSALEAKVTSDLHWKD